MSEQILIIDDDELVLSGLAANLTQHGFVVHTAPTVAAALNAIEHHKPDLALCDLILDTDVTGIELMKKMREMRPDLAVILMTGHGSIKTALEALRSGASDYIQKPADPEEVIHRIRAVLHAVHLRQALEAERDKMEIQRRETNQQQIRHDRMAAVGLMAEGAAHALSNILRPVVNYTPAIRDALPEGSPARELIAEVESAGVKAETLLGDLHYIGAGGGLEKTVIDSATFLSEVANGEDIAAIREARPKLRLEINLADQLASVEGSAQHLRRAIENLIAFAAENAPENGLVTITADSQRIERSHGRAAAKPGEYLVISVTDNGAGLNVEDLDRLFEPFYTLRIGRNISGLSLPLVYRVITDHGGRLDVTSAPGRGTTFFVYLPAAGISDAEAIELRPDYSGGETILLIDDHAGQRADAAAILTGQGYRVIPVPDGHAAVAELQKSMHEGSADRIDLAVIDFVLGEAFDGFETYKKMIEIRPRQKAILASGFTDLARLTDAKRAGVARCIPKPYVADVLTRAVREVLDA